MFGKFKRNEDHVVVGKVIHVKPTSQYEKPTRLPKAKRIRRDELEEQTSKGWSILGWFSNRRSADDALINIQDKTGALIE